MNDYGDIVHATNDPRGVFWHISNSIGLHALDIAKKHPKTEIRLAAVRLIAKTAKLIPRETTNYDLCRNLVIDQLSSAASAIEQHPAVKKYASNAIKRIMTKRQP